jgi:hypothetical protein
VSSGGCEPSAQRHPHGAAEDAAVCGPSFGMNQMCVSILGVTFAHEIPAAEPESTAGDECGRSLRQSMALLEREELTEACQIRLEDMRKKHTASIPCAGCRCGVDTLLAQLAERPHGGNRIGPFAVHTKGRAELTAGDGSLLGDHSRKGSSSSGGGGGGGTHTGMDRVCDALLSCRSTALEDWIAGTGGKSTGQKRCALHQLKSRAVGEWVDAWRLMSVECRRVLLSSISCRRLEDALQTYLSKHMKCDTCRKVVWQAFDTLVGRRVQPTKPQAVKAETHKAAAEEPDPYGAWAEEQAARRRTLWGEELLSSLGNARSKCKGVASPTTVFQPPPSKSVPEPEPEQGAESPGGDPVGAAEETAGTQQRARLPGGYLAGDKVVSRVAHTAEEGSVAIGDVGTVLGPCDALDVADAKQRVCVEFPGLKKLNIEARTQLCAAGVELANGYRIGDRVMSRISHTSKHGNVVFGDVGVVLGPCDATEATDATKRVCVQFPGPYVVNMEAVNQLHPASREEDGHHGHGSSLDATGDDEKLALQVKMFRQLKVVRGNIVVPNKLSFAEEMIDLSECKQPKHVQDGSHGYAQVLSCLGGCVCIALLDMLGQMVSNERAWFMAKHALAKTTIEMIMNKGVSKRADQIMQELLLAEEAAGTAADQIKKKRKKKKKQKKKSKNLQPPMADPPDPPAPTVQSPPASPPREASASAPQEKSGSEHPPESHAPATTIESPPASPPTTVSESVPPSTCTVKPQPHGERQPTTRAHDTMAAAAAAAREEWSRAQAQIQHEPGLRLGELQKLKPRALKEIAVAAGIDNDTIDSCMDEDDVKGALLAMLSKVKLSELQQMKPRALKEMAVAAGFDNDTVDSCMDEDDVKGALIAMLLSHDEGQPPQQPQTSASTPLWLGWSVPGGGDDEEGLSEAEIRSFKQKYGNTVLKEKAQRLARLQDECTQQWASYTCRCGAPDCMMTREGRAG